MGGAAEFNIRKIFDVYIFVSISSYRLVNLETNITFKRVTITCG